MRFFKKIIATSLVLCIVMTNCLPTLAKGGFFSFLFNDTKNEEVVELNEETILESLEEVVEETTIEDVKVKDSVEEKVEENEEEDVKETDAADVDEPEADEVLETETSLEEETEAEVETEEETTEVENVSEESKEETQDDTVASSEETTLDEVVIGDVEEKVVEAEIYGAGKREFTLSKDWKSRFSGYLTEICAVIIKKGSDSALDNANKWNKVTLTDSTTNISIEAYLTEYPAEYAPDGYEGSTVVVIDLADKVDTLYSPKDASDLFSFAKIPAQAKNSTQYALDCNIASSFRAIHGLEYLDTSRTTIFTNFFANNYYLEEIDLSNFDTSNAQWMQGMFSRCANLKSLDLSGFDTSKVSCMRGMFAGCYELTELDLTSFDTSSVTDMMAMFANCREMLSLDLSSFDTSSVENTIEMFRRMTNIEKLDLRSFDTSEVFDATRMFCDMPYLKIIIVSDKFSTESMYEDDVIFENCPRLRGKYGFQLLPTIDLCGQTIVFPYGKMFAKVDQDSEDETLRGFFTDVDEVCEDIVFDYDTEPEVFYNVSFELNGATFKDNVVVEAYENVKKGSEVSLPKAKDIIAPSNLSNPVFEGWYTTSDFSGSPVTSVAVYDNVTVYAKWTEQFKLQFELNGASFKNTVNYDNVKKGTKITLPSVNDMTVPRNLHNPLFEGWYTTSNFGGSPVTSVVVNDNVTAYAKWVESFDIDFELNGASFKNYIDEESYYYIKKGTEITLPSANDIIPPSEIVDPSFKGWYTTSDFSGSPVTSVVVNSHVVLYAKWEDYFKVQFELNGASFKNTVDEEDYNHIKKGTEVVLPSDDDLTPSANLSNPVFKGWYTTSNFSGSPVTSVVVNDNITVYAKWAENFSVQFELNGASFKNTLNQDVYKNVNKGTKVTLPVLADMNVPRNMINPAFEGWYTTSNFSGSPVTTVEVNNNVTVYAKWEAHYQVNFELDGAGFKGSLDLDQYKNLKAGTTVYLPKVTDMYLPDLENAKFLGWYTNSSFDGSAITQLTVNSNVTVYAKWDGYYNVTINKAGQYYYLDKGDILYDADTYTLRVRKGESIVIPVNDSGQFKLNGYRNRYTRCHPAKDNKTQADKYEIKDSNGEYITIVYSGDTYVPTKNNITVHGKWMIHGGDVWYYEDVYALYGRDPDMGTVIPNPLPKPKDDGIKKANATPQNKAAASGGGSSGGGGGGGGGSSAGGGGKGLTVGAAGGGGPEADLQNTPNTEVANNEMFMMASQQQSVSTQPNEAKTQAEAKTASSATYEFSNNLSTWTQNADGTWKMEINVGDTKVAASNGFYKMQNAEGNANNAAVYYFDANGQMATGWVKDENNNLYYFEPANNENVGKMQYGWKEINGSSYYFGTDGKLITNGMTPDGKYVGTDGKVVSNGTSLDAINSSNNAFNLT